MNARVEAVRILLAKASQDEYESLDQYEDAPLDRNRALRLLGELEVWIQEQMHSGQ